MERPRDEHQPIPTNSNIYLIQNKMLFYCVSLLYSHTIQNGCLHWTPSYCLLKLCSNSIYAVDYGICQPPYDSAAATASVLLEAMASAPSLAAFFFFFFAAFLETEDANKFWKINNEKNKYLSSTGFPVVKSI